MSWLNGRVQWRLRPGRLTCAEPCLPARPSPAQLSLVDCWWVVFCEQKMSVFHVCTQQNFYEWSGVFSMRRSDVARRQKSVSLACIWRIFADESMVAGRRPSVACIWSLRRRPIHEYTDWSRFIIIRRKFVCHRATSVIVTVAFWRLNTWTERIGLTNEWRLW